MLPPLACCPPVAGVISTSLSMLHHRQIARNEPRWYWLPYSVPRWLLAPFKDSETPDAWIRPAAAETLGERVPITVTDVVQIQRAFLSAGLVEDPRPHPQLGEMPFRQVSS